MSEKVITKTGGRLVPASFKQRDISAAITGGALFGALGLGVGFVLASLTIPQLGIAPPSGGMLLNAKLGLGAGLHHLCEALDKPSLAQWFAGAAKANRRHLALLAERGELWGLYARWLLIGLCGAGLGGLKFKEGMEPKDLNQHVRGYRLLEGEEAVREGKRQALLEIKAAAKNWPEPDINLHPELPGAWARWRSHTAIFGQPGSGKTVIFHHLIQAALRRGDRFIITDAKGDMVQMYPGAAIVSPFDARGIPWRISADINSAPRARDFAENLIESSKDPMWANAARSVLVGFINKLNIEQPGNWGFRELHKLCSMPLTDILPLMQTYNPDAIRAVEDANQTTTGIMINLSSFIQPIADLSAAWGDTDPESGLCFSDWLRDSSTPIRQLVFQNHGAYGPTIRACFVSIFNLIASVVDSPDFPDRRDRRLWMFLDELPAFGKVRIEPILSRARSRDLRVVLGFQNSTQLTSTWSKEEGQTIIDNVRTKIISQVPPGETATFICNLIGKVESERLNISESVQAGSKSRTFMHNREERPVIVESDLTSKLGVDGDGIKALVLGYRDVLLMLKWPFMGRPEARDPYIEAAWVRRAAMAKAQAAAPKALSAAAYQANNPTPAAQPIVVPGVSPGVPVAPAPALPPAAAGQGAPAPVAQVAPTGGANPSGRSLLGESAGGAGGFDDLDDEFAAIGRRPMSPAEQLKAISGSRGGS